GRGPARPRRAGGGCDRRGPAMSQITAEAMGHPHDHGHGMPAEALRPENVTLPAGAGAMWSTALLVLGAAGLVVTIAAGLMMEGAARQAMAAYHIGAMTALALSLGAMFWVMSFHLTQA